MKADAMIDQLDMAIGHESHVTGLTIGIIDQRIKDHYRLQQLLLNFGKGEVVLHRLYIQIKLQRSAALRTVLSKNGGRDEIPSECLAG